MTMTRTAFAYRSLLRSVAANPTTLRNAAHPIAPPRFPSSFSFSFSSSASSFPPPPSPEKDPSVSIAEARKLLRMANVETVKRRLLERKEGEEEVIGYSDFLRECQEIGAAKSAEEAAGFAAVLDEAGVILLFRDKVYLHPDKVMDVMRKVVPLALTPENDPGREELKELRKLKEDIDICAHRHVRRVLWSGLGILVCQTGLFFRLTFWEFSWDVMEPITYFTTASGLVVGYAYFLFTSKDPTYQDLMQRLFSSRQRKLFQKQKFDIERYIHLQTRSKCDLDQIKGVGGAVLKH